MAVAVAASHAAEAAGPTIVPDLAVITRGEGRGEAFGESKKPRGVEACEPYAGPERKL